MTRTYELGIVLEPRVPEDDAKTICDKYKGLVTDSGATVTYVDHWGKRKLAYPIRKYSEGRYFFIYVSADGIVPWTDIERLLMQDEKVLRHLVVRTDEDLKRADRKGKIKPQRPGQEEEAEGEGGGEGEGESKGGGEGKEAAPAPAPAAADAPADAPAPAAEASEGGE